MALTKVQKEFFTEFAKTAVTNLLLSQVPEEYAEAVLKAAEESFASADMSVLSEAIGVEFMARVDFKDVKKVDKFLRSVEYQAVSTAASEVLQAVHDELGKMLALTAVAVEEQVGSAPEQAGTTTE